MIKGLFTKFWYFLVVLLVLGAIMMAAARMMAPLANEYRAKIEEFASRALGQPVTIAGFEAGWYLYGPRFALKDVRLLDQASGQVLLRFDEARVGIDLLKSITNQRLEPSSIVIVGTGFTLVRHPGGRLSVLGFAAKQQEAATDTARDKVTAWLLSQPYIAFDESRFTWRDLEQGDRSLHFSDVSLRLRNDGNRHVLNGNALLPLSMGRRIDFAVDIVGNPLSLDEWNGDIYVAGSGIQLKSWTPKHGIYQVGLASGTADLELWSHWKRSRMVSAEGQIGIYNVKMTSIGVHDGASGDSRSLMIDSAGGRFLWQAQEAGWRVDVDRFVLTRGERMWIPTRMALLVQKRGQMEFRFASDRLLVDDLMDFIDFRRPFNGGLGEALLGIQPSGELHEVNFARTSNGGFMLHCNFQDISTRPWRQFPGISNFAGTLKSDADGGSLSVNSSGAEINFENQLRNFVRVEELNGQFSWHRDESRGWSIDARDVQFRNEDIQISADGRLLLPVNHGSPELNLTMKFDNGDIGHVSRYLPVSKMRPGLVRWLDQALISGRIRDGSVQVRGQLKDFPFDHKEGRFTVHFGVQNAILEYAANWPRLEKVEGELTFDGRQMKGLIASGKSFDSAIEQARVSIDNLAGKPPLLSVDGKARGPTRDAMRYVQESPLNEHFGRYFKNTEVSGASTLDLKIHLPLARDKTGTRVHGRLVMRDSAMLLAGGKVDIKKINGTLGFSRDGLSASGIKARILGLPGSIEIHNEMQGKNKLTVFSAAGRAGSGEYAKLVDLPQLFDRTRGSSDWRAILRLGAASGGGESDTTLTITSDLKGIAVNLPPPLGKNAMQSRQLVIDTALPRTDDTPTRIRYGNRFQAILAYRESPEGQRVDRGELRFGGRAASLPAGHGLRIAGEFDYFSLPQWQDFIDSFEPQTASPGDAATVNSLDLRIAHGRAYGRDWSTVELKGTRRPDAWQAQVTSKQLVGKLVVPHQESQALLMELNKLVMNEQKTSGNEPKMDPRELRPLKITSKHFIYKGADLGKLELDASRRQFGLHVDKFHLDSPTSDITARGDWVLVNNAHSSSFDIQIDTQDMGVLLANFGYPGNIDNGRGKISIIALWPGSPSDYAVEALEGTVAMHITDGRLLEIEPGAGRFFGLLSLQTLPRRLTLDFSDLFQKGFRFDQLSGKFSIKNGNAYTNNLFMEGPPARIDVIGRMGLAAEDFDERVTVTPHVTSSLPIAGAIAGGPGVGAAILFMQKILQPKIDRMTRYHYRVTGSWNDPVIEREPT